MSTPTKDEAIAMLRDALGTCSVRTTGGGYPSDPEKEFWFNERIVKAALAATAHLSEEQLTMSASELADRVKILRHALLNCIDTLDMEHPNFEGTALAWKALSATENLSEEQASAQEPAEIDPALYKHLVTKFEMKYGSLSYHAFQEGWKAAQEQYGAATPAAYMYHYVNFGSEVVRFKGGEWNGQQPHKTTALFTRPSQDAERLDFIEKLALSDKVQLGVTIYSGSRTANGIVDRLCWVGALDSPECTDGNEALMGDDFGEGATLRDAIDAAIEQSK